MQPVFNKIGLVGKPHHKATLSSFKRLHSFLNNAGCAVFLDQRLSASLNFDDVSFISLDEMGKTCDLVIVVGGDGNMLGAARVLSQYSTPVIGVNRGNLGFLTDLNPEQFEQDLTQVLAGEYVAEERFLLEVTVKDTQGQYDSLTAVNEAVLHSGKVAHMMEFEVYIDNNFMFSQRADGLIICTPTGSTAYSLSGGGPILTPDLEVVCLQPMYPHSLSNRPIVVDANSTIKLIIAEQSNTTSITCDGHNSLNLALADEITIHKKTNKLKLLHPKDYSYYNVIRSKLHWGSKLY
ncbi:NAD(+) kinase [Catenovulum sp. SM1970]|uniref:NAD(+) kinase n=1 Tax=Marinifaba aquimaris TaxID=2741323 RepID=UPI001572715E|nr:NAD(+) kinase [Marinifaba aquimaris]NTS77562.1 NAD(+) kinase [Marinifaba aquimaris]